MKSRIPTLSTSENSHPSNPARATILYEDLAAALRVHTWFECLAAAGRAPADLQTEFWRFDFLSEATQRKAAVKMATRSSLIVVAARDQGHLNADVECCINAWLQNQGKRPGGLALLLASAENASAYTRLTLARWWMVASEQRLNVYCDLPEWRLYSADPLRAFSTASRPILSGGNHRRRAGRVLAGKVQPARL
jgi:hypothetical protein